MTSGRGRLSARACMTGLGFILLAMAGCGSAEQVATHSAAGLEPARLPRPSVAVVGEFRVDPRIVLLDPGIGAAFVRSAGGMQNAAAQHQGAEEVRAALAHTLAARIRAMGLAATDAAPGSLVGPYVLIDGVIQAIDQGDSTSRRLLGFRRGQSRVRVVMRVSYMQPGAPPRVIGMISGSGESGWAPGMAMDLGFGVVTGTLLTSMATSAGTQAVTYRHGSAGADAAALAGQMADELGGLFARQGWITTSVLQRPAPQPALAPKRLTASTGPTF